MALRAACSISANPPRKTPRSGVSSCATACSALISSTMLLSAASRCSCGFGCGVVSCMKGISLLCLFLHYQLPMFSIQFHSITVVDAAVKQGAGKAILDLFLDHALERARAELRIVALVCQH